MSRRALLAAAGTLVVLVLAAVVLPARRPEPPAPAADAAMAPPAALPSEAAAFAEPAGKAFATRRDPGAAVPAGPPPLPESLAGTEPDGELTLDAQGRFVADAGARAFFDYFLAAAGEQPLTALRARIVAAIEARLPPAAAADAIAALDAYLDYRRRARHLVESGDVPDDLGERLALLQRVRRETLGPALADAFFGLEEQTIAADLARREILARRDLDAAERERLLHENEQSLPEAVRAARAETLLPFRLRDDEAALRAAGGSTDEVRALREQTVGAEAAARLEELDREEAQWQARLDAYRAERAAIESDPGLDPEERASRLRALLEAGFAPHERLRVVATD